MSPISDSDADRLGQKARKGGKLPHPPDRDAPLPEVREWLSNAAGLPHAVRVETVLRPGREPEDPIVLVLSNDLKLRCPHQSRLQQARTLQAFLASESDGIAQPPYLSPAEVGDFYTQLCRLGTAASHADPVSDLHERMAMYVALCELLRGSLAREHRYTTIEAMKARPAFNRAAAENQNPNAPVMLLDHLDGGRRYVRASEWVTWLRFAQGRTVDESGLVARMAELGSVRADPQAWNADRSRKVHLVLYSVPEDM